MSQRLWIYLANPFLQVLESRGFPKTVALSTFHDSRLSAATGPALVALFNAYHPLHQAIIAAYAAWNQHKGIQKGTTAGATQTRRQITGKVNEWDRAIQQVFVPGTPDYIKLFPNGHGSFQGGRQQDLISAVSALSGTLADYPSLAAVKANVDAYYAVLTGTNSSKDTAKGTTDQYAAVLEAACEAACRLMFINLGKMYELFADNLTDAEEYFDMSILHDGPQTVYTKTVQAGDIYSIAKRRLQPTDGLRIRNMGDVDLYFYLAANRNEDHGPDTFVLIAAHGKAEVTAGQLGNAPQDVWLNVHNQTMGEGSFEVTFL